MNWKKCTLAFLLACLPGALRSQLPIGAATASVARCTAIKTLDPQFGPLANACQYALSPESLPNFVCQETVHRWARGNPLDIVTEEVTFRHGHDRYSNYAINGKRVSTIENTGGWVSNALFGAELTAIFTPKSDAAFSFLRRTKTHGVIADEFAFRFEKSGLPAFTPAESNPGFSGRIRIDETTGTLMRVDLQATRIDPKQRLKSYRSAMDYREVTISDLGSLLLPVSGDVEVCLNSGVCFRNVLAFHDCRKFGSEVHIVPNVGP
jgi:hypothetical protein